MNWYSYNTVYGAVVYVTNYYKTFVCATRIVFCVSFSFIVYEATVVCVAHQGNYSADVK